jgi:hypothetical protein
VGGASVRHDVLDGHGRLFGSASLAVVPKQCCDQAGDLLGSLQPW